MNQVTTQPHHKTKNQSFLSVPFHASHSNTKASTKRSNDSSAKKPKTQTKKKLNFDTTLFPVLGLMAQLHP